MLGKIGWYSNIFLYWRYSRVSLKLWFSKPFQKTYEHQNHTFSQYLISICCFFVIWLKFIFANLTAPCNIFVLSCFCWVFLKNTPSNRKDFDMNLNSYVQTFNLIGTVIIAIQEQILWFRNLVNQQLKFCRWDLNILFLWKHRNKTSHQQSLYSCLLTWGN